MKNTAKFVLFVILGLLAFGISFAYGKFTGPIAAWIVIWLLLFYGLLFWNAGLHERGAVFAILSIAVAVAGQKWLEEEYGKQFVIELLAQVFLVIGASIGANLISDWLVKVEQPDKPKK